MLHPRGGLPDRDVRVGVSPGPVPDEHRVALAVVPGTRRGGLHLHQSSVAVPRLARGDTLAHDAGAGVLAHVDHLRAGVRLLHIVGERHAEKLTHAVVTLEHHGRVLPRDAAAGLHLRPRDLRVVSLAQTSLGDKVVDATLAVLVTRVPVLHRRVLHLGVLRRADLHHRRVQLVLVVRRGGATL